MASNGRCFGGLRNLASVAFLLALCTFAPASAQTSPTWQRIIDTGSRGEIRDMAIAPNGDIVVVGFIPSPRGPSDHWIARFNTDGAELWSRRFGSPVRDELFTVNIAANGSIHVGGARFSSPALSNGFVAKLSPEGEVIWEAILGDQRFPSYTARIELLADGSILALGSMQLVRNPAQYTTVMRLDPTGHVVWIFGPQHIDPETYPADSVFSPFDAFLMLRPDGHLDLHDRLNTAPRCVVLDADNGSPMPISCAIGGLGEASLPFHGGKFSAGATSNAYGGDPVFRKHATTGELLWERILPSEDGDGINSIAETPDGGIVGAGFRVSPLPVGRNNCDGILVKLDQAGNVVWRRVLSGRRRDELKSVAVLPDGSIIAAGYTGEAAGEWSPWLMRLNAEGELGG